MNISKNKILLLGVGSIAMIAAISIPIALLTKKSNTQSNITQKENYNYNFAHTKLNEISDNDRYKAMLEGPINKDVKKMEYSNFDSFNKFSNDTVKWLFNENPTNSPLGSSSIRQSRSVALVDDQDASLLSIFSQSDNLLEVDDIYNMLGITTRNTSAPTWLYNSSINNASATINNQKKQIGIPYGYVSNGITFTKSFVESFDSIFASNALNNLTINGTTISTIVDTSSSVEKIKQVEAYIKQHGWTWNEKVAIGETFHSYKGFLVGNNKITGDASIMSQLLFAKRYKSGQLVWDGVSNNWNTDLLNELNSLNQNSSSSNIISPFVKDNINWAFGYTSPFVVVNNQTKEKDRSLLSLPLNTKQGNDVYDDLVVSPLTLFVPNDKKFFTSEEGVDVRNKALNLFVKSSLDNNAFISNDNYYVNPFLSKTDITTHKGHDAENDVLIDLYLSGETNHFSYSETRWIGEWFEKTIVNSQYGDGDDDDDEDASFVFKPVNSVNREINLYRDYSFTLPNNK